MYRFFFIITSVLLIFPNCSRDATPDPDAGNNGENKISPEFTLIKVIQNKEIRSIIKTTDGGYAALVHAQDFDVLKLDAEFNLTWNHQYGGSKKDYAETLIQVSDGGYLVAGYSESDDGNVSLNNGSYDIWICKLNPEGNLIWERSLGGSGDEGISKEGSVLETRDGGYLLIGHTNSDNGNVVLNKGGYDAWLIKISSVGSLEFEKTFGGSDQDYGRKIIETNNSYTCLVKVNSSDGDFDAKGNWVIKMEENGTLLWSTNLQGLNSGYLSLADNNEVLAVNTSLKTFIFDKLDRDGNIKVSESLSLQTISPKQPFVNKVLTTQDGGFMVIGDLGGGDIQDAIVFRISSELDFVYARLYEGNSFDKAASLLSIDQDRFLYQMITASDDLDIVPDISGLNSVILQLDELKE